MNDQLHFFAIPALRPEAAQAELNAFLASHRVVAVEKQWLAAGAESCWAVCVGVGSPSPPGEGSGVRERGSTLRGWFNYPSSLTPTLSRRERGKTCAGP